MLETMYQPKRSCHLPLALLLVAALSACAGEEHDGGLSTAERDRARSTPTHAATVFRIPGDLELSGSLVLLVGPEERLAITFTASGDGSENLSGNASFTPEDNYRYNDGEAVISVSPAEGQEAGYASFTDAEGRLRRLFIGRVELRRDADDLFAADFSAVEEGGGDFDFSAYGTLTVTCRTSDGAGAILADPMGTHNPLCGVFL